MRNIRQRLRLRSPEYHLYGDAASDAKTLADQEAAALAAGMSMIEWQVSQQANLEQEMIGQYNRAIGILNAAGAPVEHVEEGNALIDWLYKNKDIGWTESDVIDFIKDFRTQLSNPMTAFASVGRDVRPALFTMTTDPNFTKVINRKAAILQQMLDTIRELFFLQMLNAMLNKPRSAQRDADIQKLSHQATELGAVLGLQIETEYTLQMFDKSERLVVDNLDNVNLAQDQWGYILSSPIEEVDAAMTILSTGNQATKKLFDEYVLKPRQRETIQGVIIGVAFGLLLNQLRKRRKK